MAIDNRRGYIPRDENDTQMTQAEIEANQGSKLKKLGRTAMVAGGAMLMAEGTAPNADAQIKPQQSQELASEFPTYHGKITLDRSSKDGEKVDYKTHESDTGKFHVNTYDIAKPEPGRPKTEINISVMHTVGAGAEAGSFSGEIVSNTVLTINGKPVPYARAKDVLTSLEGKNVSATGDVHVHGGSTGESQVKDLERLVLTTIQEATK